MVDNKKKKKSTEVYQDIKTTGTQPDGIEFDQPVTIKAPASAGIGRYYKEKHK